MKHNLYNVEFTRRVQEFIPKLLSYVKENQPVELYYIGCQTKNERRGSSKRKLRGNEKLKKILGTESSSDVKETVRACLVGGLIQRRRYKRTYQYALPGVFSEEELKLNVESGESFSVSEIKEKLLQYISENQPCYVTAGLNPSPTIACKKQYDKLVSFLNFRGKKVIAQALKHLLNECKVQRFRVRYSGGPFYYTLYGYNHKEKPSKITEIVKEIEEVNNLEKNFFSYLEKEREIIFEQSNLFKEGMSKLEARCQLLLDSCFKVYSDLTLTYKKELEDLKAENETLKNSPLKECEELKEKIQNLEIINGNQVSEISALKFQQKGFLEERRERISLEERVKPFEGLINRAYTLAKVEEIIKIMSGILDLY